MTTTDATPSAPEAPARARAMASDIILCAVLALVPYLWRIAAGTRRLPNDDTWAYERIFATFHETGRIVLIDWNDINLVGMLPVAKAWVTIVGFGPLQVHLLGALMALIALLALRSILQLVAPRFTTLGLATVGIYSGFVVTTGTFMADQFTFAGSLVAVALALRAVASPRPDTVRYLLVLGSVLAAAFAFSTRQQSAVVALAVFAVLYLARSRLPLGWLVFAVPYGLTAGAFHLWRSDLPDGGAAAFTFNSRLILAGWLVLLFSLALALLPLVVATVPRAVPPAMRVAVSGAAAVFAGVVDVGAWINDYLSPLGQLARSGTVVGVVAAVLLSNVVLTVVWALADRRPPANDSIAQGLLVGALLSLGFDVVAVALSSEFYSRYALFTLAMVVVTVARTTPVRMTATSVAPVWIAAAVLWGLAIWALDATQSELDAAQRAADLVACAGIGPGELDAGMVWMGAHSTGVVVADHLSQPWVDDGLPRTQHRRVFPNATRRAVMLAELPDEVDGLGVEPVQGSGLLPGSSQTYWVIVAGEEESAALGDCARAVR